jgi:glucokinase
MQHKYQELYGMDLRQELSRRLGCNPARICFLNDAAAFLTGELHQGAAEGVHHVIGITLGTGVGSAFAINGKIVESGEGVPVGGEIWNIAYQNSVVENFISTRAIVRTYEQLGGKSADVREIAGRAGEDPKARQSFERFGTDLGKILRDLCSGFHPQRIVLGGGISRAAELFLPTAERELAGAGIPLIVSTLLDRAPLIGAGIHWKQKYAAQNGEPKLEEINLVEEA